MDAHVRPDAGLPAGWSIRPLDRTAPDEIALVAQRMRATLVEVLGPARGAMMYDDAWLVARVRFHLDGAEGRGAEVFVAVDGAGALRGHTIVRVESDAPSEDAPVEDAPRTGASPSADAGGRYGLFATTYVERYARGLGVAGALLRAGERWMQARGLRQARTYTDPSNARLIALYQRHGYALARLDDAWVRLTRPLGG